MTQLPEVEVIRKELEKELQGKRFKEVTVKSAALVGRHRNRPDFYSQLEGRKIDAVARRGTYLLLHLDEGHTFVIHPGPQGVLTREKASREAGPDTQLVASFTTGGALHLVGPAKESDLFVIPTPELDSAPELATGGIDALADTFTWHAFGQELFARRSELKPLLRDESFILGLGDLYADEILWAAGLSPTRQSDTLTSQEVRRLYRALFEVLYESVKQGGVTDATAEPDPDEDDIDAEYGDFVKVYDRAGEPCIRCRRLIERRVLAGGIVSFSCPACQT